MRIPLNIFPLLLILFFGCKKPKVVSLNIATASNMQYAMKEIATAFTKETNTDCNIIVGSSGKLTAQIMEGAPYDVFFSADMKYPEMLHKNGFTKSDPKIYATGGLVLWSTLYKNPGLDNLTNENIEHIAIANPKTAPYGEAAISILKKLNLYTKIEDKLVYGESISQTNQFILSGAAEIGFTAKSVILSPHLKKKGYWVSIDESSYKPISQGVVLLKNNGSKQESKQFYAFLFSRKAKDILEKYGYSVSLDKIDTSK